MTAINTSGRFVGDWPRIGIRPAVDGRQHGVRESLEEQTRAMAIRTADLLRANLRYPDGTPVEVVVPEHNIGGVYEAAKVAELFRKEGVGVSVTITPCWCYGSETMDMDPLTPKAVWGFNGTERPGAVYLAAVLAAHTQKGLPAFGIYGRDVQDANDGTIPADVRAKILRFARAGLAGLLAPPEPPPWTGDVVPAVPPRWVGARDPYAQALGDVVRYLCRGPVAVGARQEVSG